jgi:transposase
MSKWRTENHFVSWLRLCPDNKVSGDKVIGKGRLPTNNRLTTAFKMAAKLARLVYRMLRYGMQFVDQGAEFYQARHRQHEINFLKR